MHHKDESTIKVNKARRNVLCTYHPHKKIIFGQGVRRMVYDKSGLSSQYRLSCSFCVENKLQSSYNLTKLKNLLLRFDNN